MKFVPAQARAGGADRAIDEELRLAITKMELALREARGVAEQASHGVANAFGVLEHLAEDHVAAALPVHRTRGGEARESFAEFVRGSELLRVKLGIAAGEPAGVAVLGRRLVGKRRERHDLCAGALPAVENMRV